MPASARTRRTRRGPLPSTPAPLLDTTLDQLRTLLAVHATGTALGAARYLRREQSSVQKQLDTLNRNFQEMCGEPLVLKQGRGKDVLFTGTGEVLVEMAEATLGEWSDTIRDLRSKSAGTLTVGATRYTLGIVADAIADIEDELADRGIDLKVDHIRTRDLLSRLAGNQVDLVCGSVAVRAGGDAAPDGCDVLELARGGLSLLTNLPPDRLPDGPIPVGALPDVPLVVPSDGLIADFLRGWFGPGYAERLTIAAEIDAVPFGLELLRSRLPLHGAMLVTEGIADAVRDGRLGGGTPLRAVDIADSDWEVLVGVFARKGEIGRLPAGHPLHLLWHAAARRADRGYPATDIPESPTGGI
ncbi:MAG: LysR family transcriptional regulator [Streptomycetaceae bacterium]|nr:LysR family transcriptional regulator [Streptomycetaceae bacterium]